MTPPLNDSDNSNGFKILGCYKLWQTKSFGQSLMPKLFELNVKFNTNSMNATYHQQISFHFNSTALDKDKNPSALNYNKLSKLPMN